MWRQGFIVALLAFGAFVVGWRVVYLFSGQSLSLSVRPQSSPSQESPVPNSQSQNDRRMLTLLVPLSGELGNHLHWISTAFRIKWYLERRLPLDIQIVGEHQDHPKWKNAHEDIVSCFVNLKDFVFDAGRHNDEFRRIRTKQQEFVQNYPGEFSISSTGTDCQSLFECAERRAEIVMERWRRFSDHENGEGGGNLTTVTGSNFSLPFLVLHEMDGPVIDHDTEPIRSLFQFDFASPVCCALLPEPNELIFHLRNFGVESHGKLPARDASFAELSPNQIVPFLAKELDTGGSVALISRFPDDDQTLSYQTTLLGAGYRARIIREQSGVQDFCFMLHCQQELVGLLTSTYVWWAAELGNMSATLYAKAVRNDTTFPHFIALLEPHRWRTSATGSRIRHVPRVPMD
jgi:hypothetical protein